MSAQHQTDSCEFLCLSADDVPKLLENLMQVRNKWEEIGYALRLGEQTIIDCRGKNNTLSLKNILTEWVNGNQPKEETTLKELKRALESDIVGRSRIAQDMVKGFTAAKKPLATKKPLAVKEPLVVNEALAVKKPLAVKEPLAGKVPLPAKKPLAADPRVQCRALTGDFYIQLQGGVLNISGSTLTPVDLSAVGHAFSRSSHTVTEIDMSGCGLRADHVRGFLREVSNNKLKYIQELDLSANNIGADGVEALIEALKSCSNLQELDLTANNIGPDGAAALAEALKYCNSLQALDLSANNIGADGVEALAKALKSCNNLEEVDLSANNIGAEGRAVLADLKRRIPNCLY